MQGWDSVMVKADVELGGTDQLFNILIGRDFQREEGLPQQVVFLLPILEGLDGSRKMSKSLGNYVGINEPPAEIFGKLMSISDDLMWTYYNLLTDVTLQDINEMKQGPANRRDLKKHFARRITADFHGELAANQAQRDWEAQFQEKGLPSDLETTAYSFVSPRRLFHLLVDLKLCESNTEAQRKIKEGAVSISVGDSSTPQWQR